MDREGSRLQRARSYVLGSEGERLAMPFVVFLNVVRLGGDIRG